MIPLTGSSTSGDQPHPIFVVAEEDYGQWKAAQDTRVQNWLDSRGFRPNANAWSALPGEGGALTGVLVVANETPSMFQLAELASMLPAKPFRVATNVSEPTLAQWSLGWCLAGYHFGRYRKAETEARATLCVPEQVRQANSRACAATFLVRDLINTPASDMMPEHLADAARTVAAEHGARFSETVGQDLLARNYPAIHAVGRASSHEPRLIELGWGSEEHPKLTCVGKGVCFDSGGLDIKSAAGMRLMKKDMGGAAHVLGLAQWIMSEQLPVRLRVLVPAVENAVSGRSYRPGDVVGTRSGSTVEIHNTDAEGRVVLGDALHEGASEQPDLLLDFATLTGAARVALGTSLPALFCNDDATARGLLESGHRQFDPLWRLPLHSPYREMLKSDVADLANAASAPYGGAITAALYLQHFVDTVNWAHIDLMGWNLEGKPGRPKGGEAMGLRAVFDYVKRRYA